MEVHLTKCIAVGNRFMSTLTFIESQAQEMVKALCP